MLKVQAKKKEQFKELKMKDSDGAQAPKQNKAAKRILH